MWGKFKTFFLSNLDIAATDRPKLPGCPKLLRMTVAIYKAMSAEPCIQVLPTRPHFMQNFQLDKMFYLNIITCQQVGV